MAWTGTKMWHIKLVNDPASKKDLKDEWAFY